MLDNLEFGPKLIYSSKSCFLERCAIADVAEGGPGVNLHDDIPWNLLMSYLHGPSKWPTQENRCLIKKFEKVVLGGKV